MKKLFFCFLTAEKDSKRKFAISLFLKRQQWCCRSYICRQLVFFFLHQSTYYIFPDAFSTYSFNCFVTKSSQTGVNPPLAEKLHTHALRFFLKIIGICFCNSVNLLLLLQSICLMKMTPTSYYCYYLIAANQGRFWEHAHVAVSKATLTCSPNDRGVTFHECPVHGAPRLLALWVLWWHLCRGVEYISFCLVEYKSIIYTYVYNNIIFLYPEPRKKIEDPLKYTYKLSACRAKLI